MSSVVLVLPPSRTMESVREGGVHAVCQPLAELLIVFFYYHERYQLTYLKVKMDVVQLVLPATQDKHESKYSTS